MKFELVEVAVVVIDDEAHLEASKKSQMKTLHPAIGAITIVCLMRARQAKHQANAIKASQKFTNVDRETFASVSCHAFSISIIDFCNPPQEPPILRR